MLVLFRFRCSFVLQFLLCGCPRQPRVTEPFQCRKISTATALYPLLRMEARCTLSPGTTPSHPSPMFNSPGLASRPK